MSPLVLPSTPEASSGMPGPRQDFVLLAEALGGSILYPKDDYENSLLSRVERRTATDIRQAFAALKRRRTVSVYLSLSEKVGLPLALLLLKRRTNRPAHVLIGHRLTSPNKRRLHERTGYLHRFDRVVVLATTQSEYLTREAGYPAQRANVVLDGVDTQFWSAQSPPAPNSGGARGDAEASRETDGLTSTALPLAPPELGAGGLPRSYLLAVGRERRDYDTLAGALRLIPHLRAVVVGSSPWSRAAGALLAGTAPPNMEFLAEISYAALRELYAKASVIVVPLEAATDYAAGVNACLEAMAMAKPVLVSATPGLADYCRNDVGEEVAATVPDGESASGWRAAIESLLADPARRERLAVAGRRFVEKRADVEVYVANVTRVVQEALAE